MKKLFVVMTFIFTSAALFAFDWPQQEIMSDTFFTYFGQLRGGLMSPSLVFSGSDEIKTSDQGYVTVVLSEHDEQPDLFESTLGNAVIVQHKDSMLTVYANLSQEDHAQRYELNEVETAQPLGKCGNSGWQEGNALLEFQVIDLASKKLVNPRLLMPRFGKELPLTITNVTAVNKKGTVFDLNSQKSLASGTYYIYRDSQTLSMPYKTTVLINGTAVESITWDTIVASKGNLCTEGKKLYPVSTVYPNSKKQLIAEVTIPKGKSRLTISLTDILGNEKTLTYSVEAH